MLYIIILNTSMSSISDETDYQSDIEVDNNSLINESISSETESETNILANDMNQLTLNHYYSNPNGTQWITLVDHNQKQVYVNIADKFMFNQSAFADIIKTELPLHQIYDVNAMIQLEEHPYIIKNNQIIKTTAGVLSEPFGSGKTLIVLALIALDKKLQQSKTIETDNIDQSYNATYSLLSNPLTPLVCDTSTISNVVDNITYKLMKERFTPFEVNITYKNIINPTMILCNVSVITAWEDAIQRFTNLKYLKIDSVHGLIKLNSIINKGLVNEYDIILVKNKTIVGKFNFPGFNDVRNNSKKRYIINMIAILMKNHNMCWKRVIYDDYDTIQPPDNSCFVVSKFTWIVSGTNKNQDDQPLITNIYNSNIKQLLDYSDYMFNRLNHSNELWSIFNVSCQKLFTSECIKTGIPSFLVYEFDNPNDKCIDLIGAIQSNNIVEMLNGDAIETAASEIGIKSTSVVDMFEKLLDDKFEIYNKALKLETHLDSIDCHDLPIYNGETQYTFTLDDFMKCKTPKYQCNNLEYNLSLAKQKCNSMKEKASVAINRVKDNLKDEDCIICYDELKGNDIMIMKCCNAILCSTCSIQGSHFREQGYDIIGNCAKCRQIINLTNDIVFINKQFDISNILDDNMDYVAKELPDDIEQGTLDDESTKLDILLKIIKGESIRKERREVNIDVAKLLIGTEQLDEAPSDQRSVIVFASYEETLNHMSERFKEHNIDARRIEGTASNIGQIVKDFDNKKFPVLLLKTEESCAGLNLQSATDLVYMHKILDYSMEAQSLGRIQRFGRKYKANIHFLLYKNELGYFSFL